MRITKETMKAALSQLSATANKARTLKLSPERRSEIASLAICARYNTSPLKIAQRTAGIISDRKRGMSVEQIAGKRGVCESTVRQTLRNAGMGRPKKSEKL
jgi:DNA-binding NarL/FixJ family response regulator